MGVTSADSNTQTDSPSGPISFHQRRPQRRRPETFFTVQKSNARSRTIITKRNTLFTVNFVTHGGGEGGDNESVKRMPRRYVNRAATESVTKLLGGDLPTRKRR